MSRFAVAFLLALVLPQAAATGFMGKQPQKEVDPAAATAEVVTEEPVIKVEAAPEQPEDQVYNLAADAAEAQDTDDVEEDAVDDDEEGEASEDASVATISGAHIDEVVAMQQKEGTEEVDAATQKMAAELEISEEDEADDVDEDGDEEEEDEASEDEDSEDTSAEDPIDEM
mmetsp:Transcript_107285/g.231004  ORF Transcript_107285/g.231004 Transcript_107285/m.231004 type:complete len:171 (+) Transcript_107285:69-581(+)